MSLEEKIDIVKDILKDKKVALGFSGGADSTLIAYLSSKVASDTLAITIDNHLMPRGFIENTRNIAESFAIKHEIIDVDFFQTDYILENNSKRCFNCRTLMYSQIEKAAQENGFDFICDGNNISDLVIDRPGILVTYKKGFETPFIEAKLTSKEIHEYLNKNNIPFSRSTTCLATRIPTCTPVTQEKISRISCCEDYVGKNTSCEIVKARIMDDMILLEVDKPDEILKDDKYSLINDELKRHGFKKVALNLSKIDDDEYIKIDYNKGSFSYRLPFTVNLENSKELLEGQIVNETKQKIELEKIIINKNGLIEGNSFKTYDDALYSFMDVLPKLRRNI